MPSISRIVFLDPLAPIGRGWLAGFFSLVALLLLALPASAQSSGLAVGNVVFIDNDGDGHYTPGVDDVSSGVTVQLFASGDNPLSDSPVDVVMTQFNGTFLFQNVPAGTFFVYIPSAEFQPGGHLNGLKTLPTNASGDDDVGQDAIPDELASTHGISTVPFTLVANNAPTAGTNETGFDSGSDDADDANGNLTIDLGFFPPVSVGNLVFADANNDGVASANEGKQGVWVELYHSEDDPTNGLYVAHAQTGAGGLFLFSGLQPGYYKLYVPPSEFGPGGVLAGAHSMSNTAAPGSDDNAGEDGLDDANPASNGIVTDPFPLYPGLAPTAFDGETGIASTSDDLTGDTDTDLTRDLGFIIPNADLSVGNLVFVDADKNGIYSTGEGKQGVTVKLFREGDNPSSALAVSTMQTAADGTYQFVGLLPGRYFVHVPASDFATSAALSGLISVPDKGPDNGLDDNADENGMDMANPASSGISSNVFELVSHGEPTDADTETGYGATADNTADDNANLTIDLGFVCPPMSVSPLTLPSAALTINYNQTLAVVGGSGTITWDLVNSTLPNGISLTAAGVLNGVPTVTGDTVFTVRATGEGNCTATRTYTLTVLAAQAVGVGNLVFIDTNGNHIADPGEGVDGVTVQLFASTSLNPLADPELQHATTSGGGLYSFTGLEVGSYYLHIPGTEFTAGHPLYHQKSIQGWGADIGADDNADENGIDDANPAGNGISSIVFSLSSGNEPHDGSTETGIGASNDNGSDTSTDLTIDLGFDSACPAITATPSSPAFATINHSYNQALSATGGTAPYTFSLQSGTLPVGITLSQAGVISGTTTVSGTTPLTVRITDTAQCSSDVPMTFLVKNEVSIGNLVFFDVNNNGYADANEGVDGVSVELYNAADIIGSATALATKTTASGGRYLFDHLISGDYKAHVTSANFSTGAPLYQMLSMGGTVDGTDDDTGEDGLDAINPSSTGVSTASFTVVAGSAPTQGTGENGFHSADDNATDADVDLTHDFGFVDAHALPATWATWLVTKSLSPTTLPTDNFDGDTKSNLIEYALDLEPKSGLPSTMPHLALVANATTGHYDFSFVRRRGGQSDLTYSLKIISNLSNSPAGWTTSTIVPTVVINTDGTETVTYASVDMESIFTGQPRGFVRLSVGLDTNGDTNPEATSASQTYGWQQVDVQVRNQTFSTGFMREEVYSGIVDQVLTNTLDVTSTVGLGNVKAQMVAGREYCVEVTNGIYKGHRWEVDEASSTAASIVLLPAHSRSTLTTVPTELAGASVAVIPYTQVNDLFPAAGFHPTNSSGTADQLIFYERATSSYTTLWDFANSGNARWVTGIAFGTDAGTRILSPVDGLFVRPRLNPITLKSYGIVRQWEAACQLAVGNNFIGNPWPVAQSPNSRQMTTTNGFTTANSFTRADRINIWNGDTTASSGYTNYYLLTSGAIVNRWVRQSDLTFAVQDNSALFAPVGTSFIISISGKSDWVLPMPWTP